VDEGARDRQRGFEGINAGIDTKESFMNSAITRIEWARSVWLRVELGQSYDNFTTWFGAFQSAREAI